MAGVDPFVAGIVAILAGLVAVASLGPPPTPRATASTALNDALPLRRTHSSLDTAGTLLASWSKGVSLSPRSEPTGEVGVGEGGGGFTGGGGGGGFTHRVGGGGGFFNLIVVLVGTYLASVTFATDANDACAAPAAASAADLLAGARALPALALDAAGLVALTAAAALGQAALVARGALPPASLAGRALLALSELALLLAAVARARARATDWPPLARLALATEGVVLALKLHSFVRVNDELGAAAAALERGGLLRAGAFPWPACATDAPSFCVWLAAPLLVFEPLSHVPRSHRVRPIYVAEKLIVGAAAVLAALVLTGREVLPPLRALGLAAAARRARGAPPSEDVRAVALAVARIAVPWTLTMLLVFWAVFESVLNALAELTRVAARGWYGTFESSTSFTEFSRSWNVPVSSWLRRHVYLAAQGLGRPAVLAGEPWGGALAAAASTPPAGGAGEPAGEPPALPPALPPRAAPTLLPPAPPRAAAAARARHLSARAALALTFLVSILLHETVLFAVFGFTTPWLALLSLAQLPLATIMRANAFKGRRLGNLAFWAGLSLGSAAVVALYARDAHWK